jgi:hypothetical protein
MAYIIQTNTTFTNNKTGEQKNLIEYLKNVHSGGVFYIRELTSNISEAMEFPTIHKAKQSATRKTDKIIRAPH